jgi:hypothetical protein
MTIDLIAKSMLLKVETRYFLVEPAGGIQRFIPCYEMKSSGLNVGLTWGLYPFLVFAESTRDKENDYY